MGRLALIGGHSILGSDPAAGFERRSVPTEAGPVVVHERGDQVLLQRHGFEAYTTAARVDHASNFAALAELGCDRALAIGSVGGLRDRARRRHVPLPRRLHRAAPRPARSPTSTPASGCPASIRPGGRASSRRGTGSREPEVIDGGVYWQAIGPRFETPAEIRLIAAHADVIGMTDRLRVDHRR